MKSKMKVLSIICICLGSLTSQAEIDIDNKNSVPQVVQLNSHNVNYPYFINDEYNKYLHVNGTAGSSGTTWELAFDGIYNGLVYYNIKSSLRPEGCIYDSSGSNSAKFDRSCNTKYSRAQWKFVETGTPSVYKVINRKGRCLQVRTSDSLLQAVTCNNNSTQLWHIDTTN